MILRDLMVRTGRRASQSMECLSKILRLKRSGARQLELVSMEDRLLFSAAPGPAPEAPADNAQIETVIIASLEAPIEILSDGAAEESNAVNAQGLQPLGLDVDTNAETHELVFIDTGAANYQDLLDDLWTHQDPDRHIDVVLLSSGEDGIAQITETLAQYRTEKLDAVHLVTHGADRAIKLGNTWLDATALEQHRDQIASWGESLNPGADLLIYGCDLAGNDLGRALLNNLVDLTGADIAASIDETGSALLGGDWDLEYELGDIETEVAFSELTQEEYDGLLNTFLVTSTANSGAGTLRQAIADAQALAGTDTISFASLGSGVKTINLTSTLTISSNVILDGWTAASYSGTPQIVLNGSSAGLGTSGITVTSGASGSIIRGLVIQQFTANGILLDGASNVTIEGNYIGTDVTGLLDRGNGEDGIQLQNGASINTIGGLTAAERNVISGNNNAGIAIDGATTSSNTILGNYIGIGSDGSTTLGNTHDGIHLQAATNTVIGSSNPAGRNVISGNAINGIGMDSAVGTVVRGNYIGTNAAGTAAVGNQGQGIYLGNLSTSNVIGTDLNGTSDATEGNLISGNADNGIQFWGANVSSNAIRGNIIGLNAAQSAKLANGTQGIQFGSGANSNVIGGTSSLAANVVAGNTNAGVELLGAGTSFNAVLGNFIGTNASSATGLGNSNGVLILGGASFNTIGGTTSSARNIISGNQYYGVDITGTGTNNNAIQGNYIGTNVAGTAALANGAIGVIIEAGASNNTIGGSTSARNIISGNTEYGIDVTGATTDSNVITSNYIGLDATGTTAISNGGWGIAVDFNATGTIIGGTGAGDGNVISGNTNSSPSSGRGGIYVWGSNTRIQGNTIGLNAARTAAVANGSLAATYSAGIWVNGGGTGNQIGGTTSSAANTISGNVGAGIATDTSTNTVSIQRNSIYANSGLGIDLAHDGATLNDPGDSDTGTNTLLNFPVIYSATIVGGFVTITGEARFGATVDFYESDDAAGSPGEGRTWIGSGLVSGFTAGTIDSTARQFSFTFAVGSLVSGDRVTATATLSGSTSEFSSNVTDLAPGITVTPTSGLTTTEAGGTASFTVVLDSAPTASVSIQLGSTDTTEGTISGATLVGNTLTFTTANWSTPQTITVTGVNDSLSDGDITYSISTLSATSSDLNYNGINPSDVSVTNIDNDLYTISGTIYEDVDGDGQVSDDGVGLASAIVSLYRDDGDGVLDAGDLIVNSIVANGSGQYSFTGLSNDTYWVVADSRSFIGTGGLNGGYTIHDQWAEQTYGSTGSVGWNGSAYTFTGTAGAHFGGMRSDRGDNGASLLTAEHVTRVAVASANVASVDYGFSYNVITNTRDGDEVAANNRTVQGSLRQFVQNSNALVTTQSSNFQIGTGAQAISLTSMLDNLSDTVILDATTQEGFSGTPLIVLDGNNAAGDGFHLTATADFSTIRGFVIRDFVGDAIEIIDGSDGNTIAGNYLGALTTSGTDAGATERNGESGLAISGANNTIGGSTAADRNVISANNLEGIAISGTGATGNLIVGNYIGTTATGAGDLGNGQDGILLYNGASSNTIGGVNAADRNIISGNNEGIEVTGSTTSLNVIQGNYIGLGSDGATAIGNDFDGIHISQGAHDNTIGGSISGARNVISASGANGIQIEGTGTDNNVVQGNFIGTDATGELDRGNASDGVRIGNGAQSNTIGGTTPEARNVISGNDGDGVDIQGTGTTGNVVQGNYIGTDDDGEQDLGNSSEGVDVSADGNTIGGSVAGAGNVISGNNLRGVYVTGAGVSATIQGNYVGTDKDGLQALGNSFDGIEVNFGAGAVSIRDNLVAANGQWGINLSGTGAGNTVDGNTVGLNLTQNGVLGGTGIGASSDGHTITGNTIGGSSSYGIYLTGSANNTIQGNFIGTNSTGATGLGNAWQGIGIDGANSDDNLIGGTDTGEGNVFANNTRDGIAIASGAGTRISILGNTFRSNGGLAIDLSDNGVTDNDNSGSPDDQDVGPNGLQNFPEFSSIQLSGSDLILQGDLRTDGLLTAYRLEFYGNPAGTADATNGEGRIYLGSTTVTTDSDGRVDFNVTLGAAGLVLGDSVTATATRIESLAQVSVSDFLAYGSTSEFATNTLITSANNAPTIAASSTLNSISEDDVSNSGTLVSQMVDTEVTDADAGALKGIAIISVPTTNGTWEYTLNGTTWLSVGTPSTTAALLLPADATTAIRFVPNSNFNGVSGLLNYKAWDQTSGTAGGTADVTFSGATTAFSTGTNGTSVSVSAVNDQPVFTSLDGAPTYVEGGAGVILDSNVSIFDADLSAIDDFDGATLTWVRQGGANPDDALAFDGVTVTTSGTDLFVGGVQVGTYLFTGGTLSIEFGAGATSVQVNMVMQNIVYWNNSDNPPASVQIDWTFSDGNTGAQGTGGALQATGSITVGITAVNDAPVLDNTGTMTLATITEDDIGNLGHTVASIIASAGGDRITDADAGAAEGIAVTGVWTDSGNGVWQYSLDGGSHWLLLSSAGSNSSLLLRDTDRLRFVPDEASAGSGHLTFRAWDRSDGNSAGTRVGTSSNGGTSAFSASSATASITVTALNDTPMFGIRPGVAVTALGSTNDYGRGMVLQADGKVIVAGFTDVAGTDDIALTRYNPNGTLDTSFGGGDGIVITNLGGDDQANGVVLQADGKIVVAGYSTVAGTRDFALVRYNADGTLDTSFGGGDGIVNTDLGGSDVARSVALQADGRIVVAGGGALVRYNSDGSLDTSFGGGDGIVANTSDARSVAVQADGKIVVAGFRSNGSNSDYALTRYNSDGSLDLSFGGGAGTVTTDLGGGNDYGSSVTLQPDGRIIVAGDGIGATGSRDFGLVRYNSDGTLDASFGGGDGIVTTDVQGDWDYGRAVTLQADGKIVLAGSGYRNSSEIGIQLARYNADGTLDTSFGGGDGTVTTTLGRYWDEATGVAVQADGTIVAAGYTGNSNGFAVVRYNANGTLDATFTSNRLDGTPTFTEGGAAVVLDADVAVRDADLDALNSGDGDYSGASLTLVRNAGANVQDQFSFNDGNGISLVGANLVKNGQAIASFDTTSTPGQLVIVFTNANGEVPTTADAAAVARQITYTNSSDTPPTGVSIDWTFSDGNSGAQGFGGALTASGMTTVTIISSNDAPSLVSSSTLNSINEDEFNNSGTLVSSLIATSFSDADAGALRGIAITSVNASHGAWEYTLDGTNWLSIGTPTTTASLLLAADATTAVRFIPNADYAGVSGLMDYRAWDQTTGTAGGTADTSITGGSTAFSVGINGTSVSVAAVNDAPILTAGSINDLIVQEDSGLTSLGLGGLAFAPGGGADEAGQTLTYQVTAIPHPTFFGSIYLADGTTLVSTGTYTLSQVQGMQFRPVANQNGGPSYFAFNVIDSGGTGNGGVNNTGLSIQLNITAANDAPTIATNTLTITEGATVVLANSDINATDPDTAATNLTYNASNISGGQFELVATPGSAITSFTQAQINSGAVQFVHDGGETAPSYQLTVSDGSLSHGPSTVSIGTFTNLNDAPVIAFGQGNITHTEGTSISTIDSSVSVTDIDSTDFASGTLTVTVSGGDASDQPVVQNQGTGVGQVSVLGFNISYNNGLGSVTVGTWSGGSGLPLVVTFTSAATATEVAAVARAFGFQNFSSNPSSADRTVQFQLTDGDGGTSAAATKTIHFTTVNTAPTVSGPPSVTTDVDTLVTFSLTNGNAVSVNDLDAGLNPIQVRLSVTTGSLTLSTDVGLTFIVIV